MKDRGVVASPFIGARQTDRHRPIHQQRLRTNAHVPRVCLSASRVNRFTLLAWLAKGSRDTRNGKTRRDGRRRRLLTAAPRVGAASRVCPPFPPTDDAHGRSDGGPGPAADNASALFNRADERDQNTHTRPHLQLKLATEHSHVT